MTGTKAKVANGYRIGWGLFFVASAVFNAVITLPNAEKVMEAFEGLSVPGADALLRALMPFAAGLIAAVVVMEAVVGALILSKGNRARLGLAASMAWIVGLVPFLSWYGAVNLVLAVSLITVIGRDYDKSLYDMTVGRLGGKDPGVVLRYTTLTVTALMAFAGFFGGVALMTNDDFVPGGYLDKTPFSSWVIPGILLIAFVALPMLAATAVIVFRRSATGLAAAAAGAFLAAWIVGQLAVLDYGMVLQPAMLLAGLGIAGVGLLIHARTGEERWELSAALDQYLGRFHLKRMGRRGRFVGGLR
jgi:hypothetical protein